MATWEAGAGADALKDKDGPHCALAGSRGLRPAVPREAPSAPWLVCGLSVHTHRQVRLSGGSPDVNECFWG